jgi:Domain of unknown function (DUF4349)
VRGVRRRIAVAATVGVALLGVFGAVVALVDGSSGDGSGTTSSAGSPMIAPAPAPEIGTAEGPSGAAGTSADDARDKSPVQPPSPGGAAETIGRDVVRTAQLTVQVADPTAATRGVRTAVAAAGGVISEEQVDGTGAWLVVRVPAAGLDRLVDDLAATGTVLGRSGRTEDATEQVVDLDSRVATQQASVTRVRALLAQATSIGDIVSVESELARREADLDSLQRRLATLKDRVALSTLTVELRTASTPAPADPAGFGAGLGAGWSGLKVIGSGLATATGFLLPFLPLLAVAGAVVWAVRRRAGRRRGGPGPEGGI